MKKIIISALISLMLAGAVAIGAAAVDFTVSPAATGEILGDASGDGAVNARDILSIKREMVNIEKAEVGADANTDGKVNARDILAIKRQMVGIEQLADIVGARVKIIAVDGVNVKDMAIVAPAWTNPERDNAAYAADQLRRYINVATGYERGVEYGKASTEHAIYVQYDPTIKGDPTSLYSTAGELGEEGFIIEVKDGNVYITGGRLRGCMYGVFEFLEEYIGYRFVMNSDDPYDMFVYRTDIVNLKDGIYDRQMPAVKYRHAGGRTMGGGNGVYTKARKLNAAGGFSYNDRKYGYCMANHYINAHSFAYYRDDTWPRSSSKEWYDKIDDLNRLWQPCFARDYDEMFRGLLRNSDMIFGNETLVPGQSRFSFSIMDNENYCQCPECRAMYDQLGVSGASVQFASRAADEYQKYYPGVKLYTILYNHTPPTDDVYVSPNLAIMYCGTGCNHHIPGSGMCTEEGTPVLHRSNTIDETSFPMWCQKSDEVYMWYYAVNYMCYLAPTPNVTHVYGDFHFVYDNGGEGFYHEGSTSNPAYSFEGLKAYLSALLNWDADMSREEFDYKMLEYLYIMYGGGYEELYELILLMEENGEVENCWINNHDYAWDMYNQENVRKNYERTVELLDKALAKTYSTAQRKRVRELYLHVHFLGLSATYDEVYKNGTDAQRAEYVSRYEWMYNYLKDNRLRIFGTDDWVLPKTCNLDTSPMDQFYGGGYSG